MLVRSSAAILRDSFAKVSRLQGRIWILELVLHGALHSITHILTGSWQ